MVFRKMPYQQLLFPSTSARWFPAPEGEGLGVETVLSSIPFYLPLSPFISLYLLPLITDPTPAPPLQGRGVVSNEG